MEAVDSSKIGIVGDLNKELLDLGFNEFSLAFDDSDGGFGIAMKWITCLPN